MAATVCAIVINYFGAEKTAQCLDSLRSEPLTTLLLVDNSATDEQREKMAGLVADLQERGAGFGIQAMNNEDNLGFGRAINRAIAMDLQRTGGHDYYLLLNNDARVTPGLVSGLLRSAAQDPKPALVAPRIRWGEREIDYYWYQPLLGHVSTSPFPGSFKYLSGCCLLVDRAMAPDGQLFDERFFMYGEDIALTVKATRAGREIFCADDLSVTHEGSGSARVGSLFYEYHVARGHILLALSPSNSFVVVSAAVAGRFLYLTARAVIRTLRLRSLCPLGGLAMAWKPDQFLST